MIVLDTQVWLWWVNGDHQRLKPHWLERIERADIVVVSAISCFEIAWLDQHARIKLECSRPEWFDRALAGSGIEMLPLTTEIMSCAVDLPEHHRDPQDRMIIATALMHGAELISADGKFPLYTELTGFLIN